MRLMGNIFSAEDFSASMPLNGTTRSSGKEQPTMTTPKVLAVANKVHLSLLIGVLFLKILALLNKLNLKS